LYCS